MNPIRARSAPTWRGAIVVGLLFLAVLLLRFSGRAEAAGPAASAPASSGAPHAVITFATDLGDQGGDTYIADPDGSNARVLVHGANGGPFSPDGSHLIVFPVAGGFSIVDVAAGTASTAANDEMASLAGSNGGYSAWGWSGDGTNLVGWVDNGNGIGKLYTVKADGSTPPIAVGDIAVNSAVWSPDSRWIAFSTGQPTPGLYVIHPDGTGLTQIGPNVVDDPQDPRAAYAGITWSPDSTHVAFNRPADGQTSADLADVNDIYTVAIDGSGLTDISNAQYSDAAPEWSPDGTHIAWRHRTSNGLGKTVQLGIADVAAGTSHVLPTQVQAGFFGWSPDGTHLLTATADKMQLTELDVSGSTPATTFSPSVDNAPLGTPLIGWYDWHEVP
jgi:Tol biopolymer transport system component